MTSLKFPPACSHLVADDDATQLHAQGSNRCKSTTPATARLIASASTTLWKALIMMAFFIGIGVPVISTDVGLEHPASFGSGLSTSDQSTPPPIGIIIMAQGRSGSTMLGEMFRQSEDVLYWYEPCRWLNHESKTNAECLELLSRIVTCTFTKNDSIWLRRDSESIRRGSEGLRPFLTGMSRDESHFKVLDTCRRSRAVVVKSIRLGGGVLLEDGLAPGTLVLHLVRDPRAVTRSERTNFHITGGVATDTDEVAKSRAVGNKVCEVYRRQLDTVAKLDSNNRNMRLQYEDMAVSPVLTAKLLYCWSGLGVVPANVLNWIEANTKLPGCQNNQGGRRQLAPNDSSRPVNTDRDLQEDLIANAPNRVIPKDTGGDPKSALCAQNEQEAKRRPYETRRDSASTATLWRIQMPKEEADAVWESCEASNVMRELGYHH